MKTKIKYWIAYLLIFYTPMWTWLRYGHIVYRKDKYQTKILVERAAYKWAWKIVLAAANNQGDF